MQNKSVSLSFHLSSGAHNCNCVEAQATVGQAAQALNEKSVTQQVD